MAYEDDEYYEDESEDFTEETVDDWEPYIPPEEEPPPPPPEEPPPPPPEEEPPPPLQEPAPVTDNEPQPKPYQVASADTGTRTDATYESTPPVEDDWEPYKPPATAAAPAGAKPAGDDWEPYTPEQPKRGFVERTEAGWKGGFGDQPVGYSLETLEKYPWLKPVSPIIAGADLAMRAVPGVVGAITGAGAATAEKFGMSRQEADRLQRDLKIMGEAALVEPGMGLAASRPSAQQQGWARGARKLPEPVPEAPVTQPGVKNQDWTGPPQDVPPPPPPAQGQLPLGQGRTPYPYDVRTGEAALSRGEIARKEDLAQRWENLTPQEKAEYNALNERDPSAAVKTAAPRPQAGGGEAQPGLFPEPPGEMGRLTPDERKIQNDLAMRWEHLTPKEKAQFDALRQKEMTETPRPERPGPSVQPELPIEPPVHAPPAPGQQGFNIKAPDIHSRPAGPPTAGVAKEATPPTTAGVNAPNYPRYNKWPAVGEAARRGEPEPKPHSVIGQALVSDTPPAQAKGINVLQPGHGDPTLQHTFSFDQPATKPPQKTFEAPRPPDGTHPPPAPEPIPRERSLVPSPQTTQGVTEPPVLPGHTRMYKGDPRSATDFTTDRKAAERYGPVRHVDVPDAQVKAQFTPRPDTPNAYTANKLWEAPNYQARVQLTGEVRTPETKPQGMPPTTPTAPPEPPPAQGGPKPAGGGAPLSEPQMASSALETKLAAQAEKPPAPPPAPAAGAVPPIPPAGAAPAAQAVGKPMIWKTATKNTPVRVSPVPHPKPGYVNITYGKNGKYKQAVPIGQLHEPPPPKGQKAAPAAAAPAPPAPVAPAAAKPAPVAPTAAKPGSPKPTTITVKTNGKTHTVTSLGQTTFGKILGDHPPRHGLIGSLMDFVQDKVLRQIGNMPVHYISAHDMVKTGGSVRSAFYDPLHHHIAVTHELMADKTHSAHAIIHEGIHGVSSAAILTDHRVRSAIRALMMDVAKSEAHKTAKAGGTKLDSQLNYGFINEREFLAEAFSNPRFQKMLADHNISKDTAAALKHYLGDQSPKSAWKSIVETVRKILGVPAGKTSVLEAAMRATENAMGKNEARSKLIQESQGRKYAENKYSIDPSPPGGGKASVTARDKFGNEIKFTGETVHAAAAKAMKNKYSNIFNEDGTPYREPKAAAQTAAQTPANTAQTSAKTAQTAQTVPATVQPPGKPALSLPQRAMEKLPEGKFRDAVHSAAGKIMDIGNELQMAAAPMARGSEAAMAAAKDFASNLRLNRQEWAWADEHLDKNFTPQRRRAMWDAADAESVAQQTGKPAPNGLASLRPEERAAIQEIQGRSKAAWEEAKRLDMVAGEGLPAYTPRMLVNLVGGTGTKGPTKLDPMGMNLRTKTGQMKHREHLTAAETEAAGKAKFGEQAELVRDIRTLPLATGKLEDAIAGRKLVDSIREAGRRTGDATVVEGGKPIGSPHKWFTIDHPSLKVWRATLDNAGNKTFREVPLYIRSDFEGPLRAVLSTESGRLYQGAMELKGKTMSLIMNSPLIHNAVEWGRAVPAMPGKVMTFKVYFEGNRIKQDKAAMREAITNGLVPIGGRGYLQDINAIMEAPNMKAGRSWTAKALAYIPGKISPEAGTAVKRGVDKAGDVWHNKFLWDRVGDLQVGLYANFMADLMSKGIDRQTASRTAAHWANRYAGALPQEAMSANAHKLANMLLFSRSFTMGNLGAMKDMVNGLPRDVRAQISRDVGKLDPKAEGAIKSIAQRKAIAIIALDVVAGMYVLNSLLQSASNVIRGEKSVDEELRSYADRFSTMAGHVQEHPLSLLQPFHLLEGLSATSENEPGKQERIMIGYTADGQAIYARNPVGKIGEEFVGWAATPLDMFKRKMSTTARPAWQIMSNDKGFGRKVYDPQAKTLDEHGKNFLKIAEHIVMAQTPEMQLKAGKDLITGEGDPKLNTMQTFGPIAGVTFSRGAPGGPAMGELYRAREKYQYKVNDELPEIRRMIKRGDVDGAIDRMNELGIARPLQKFYIRTTENPETRLSPKLQKDFERYATPDEKERFRRQLERQGIR